MSTLILLPRSITSQTVTGGRSGREVTDLGVVSEPTVPGYSGRGTPYTLKTWKEGQNDIWICQEFFIFFFFVCWGVLRWGD